MKPLLILSLLFLASCQQYRYDITYEKCNGSTGSVYYIGRSEPHITEFDFSPWNWYAHPVLPRLVASWYKPIINVCDFSYTKTLIK